jgi:hypothetical protein
MTTPSDGAFLTLHALGWSLAPGGYVKPTATVLVHHIPARQQAEMTAVIEVSPAQPPEDRP